MVLLITAAAPEPNVLIARLASKNRGERESASVALEALGPKELDALRAARDGRDPDLQRQATTLIKNGTCISLFRDEVVGPTWDHGPFRALIEEAVLEDRQRKFHLASGGLTPPPVDGKPQYYIGMRIMVEPRVKR
jgi:hypothetical protein